MTIRINRILNRIAKTILLGLLLLPVVTPTLAAGPATAKLLTDGLADYRQQRPGADVAPLSEESGATSLPVFFHADRKSTFRFFVAVICILCAAIAAPIIMLTTTDDPREIKNCYNLGCSRYLTKPVQYRKFAEMLRRLGPSS